MKIFDVEQGTDEWWACKIGIPSASNFDKILTPSELKPSRSHTTYRNKLLGEWLRGKPDESFQSEWMKRGNEYEDEARQYFAFEHGAELEQVGFCMYNGYGCSPDALMVAEKEGLEIKCPSPGVQAGYLLKETLPTDYILQVAGSLLVTGYQTWNFLSYHPDMPPFEIRMTRTDMQREIEALDIALAKFVKSIEAAKQQLISKGYTPMSEAA